jgi:FMN-dependent NADH-azoreductase
MARLLHLDSSSQSETSVTRRLGKELIARYSSEQPDLEVSYRDLVEQTVPLVSESVLKATYTPPDTRNDEQKKLLESISVYADEVVAADFIVIGAPMYNFTVPAALKAYIDLIVQPGKTFAYENGLPLPLLKGLNKKVIVLTASGGNYDNEPYKSADFLEPYLRVIFGFIGIDDIEFVKVQGHDAETIEAEFKRATTKLKELASIQPALALSTGARSTKSP